MKITKCDHHPDRDAVATFRIIELSVGARPLLLGYSSGTHFIIDLCEECAAKVRIVKELNGRT